jgi:hypothetical protein
MPRRKDPTTRTAPEIIADVLRWAERQSFENIAADMCCATVGLRGRY